MFEEDDNTVDLGPDDLVSSLEFSCTVTNVGHFDLTWTVPAEVTNYKTCRENVNSTSGSSVLLSRLSPSHMGDYVCRASYILNVSATPPSRDRVIPLNLIGKSRILYQNEYIILILLLYLVNQGNLSHLQLTLYRQLTQVYP